MHHLYSDLRSAWGWLRPGRDSCALACDSDFGGAGRILPSIADPRYILQSIRPRPRLPKGTSRCQHHGSVMELCAPFWVLLGLGAPLFGARLIRMTYGTVSSSSVKNNDYHLVSYLAKYKLHDCPHNNCITNKSTSCGGYSCLLNPAVA